MGDVSSSGPLDADAIIEAMLPLAFRGYAIEPVDELLARIADEVEDRDRTIAGLRATARRLESENEEFRIALADAQRARDVPR